MQRLGGCEAEMHTDIWVVISMFATAFAIFSLTNADSKMEKRIERLEKILAERKEGR